MKQDEKQTYTDKGTPLVYLAEGKAQIELWWLLKVDLKEVAFPAQFPRFTFHEKNTTSLSRLPSLSL